MEVRWRSGEDSGSKSSMVFTCSGVDRPGMGSASSGKEVMDVRDQWVWVGALLVEISGRAGRRLDRRDGEM